MAEELPQGALIENEDGRILPLEHRTLLIQMLPVQRTEIIQTRDDQYPHLLLAYCFDKGLSRPGLDVNRFNVAYSSQLLHERTNDLPHLVLGNHKSKPLIGTKSFEYVEGEITQFRRRGMKVHVRPANWSSSGAITGCTEKAKGEERLRYSNMRRVAMSSRSS